MTTSVIRIVACLGLVVGSSLAPSPTHARSAPASEARERSQGHLLEGDAALEDGRTAEAASSYRAAYQALEDTDRAGYLRSIPLRKALRAYEQLVQDEPDADRRRALVLEQRELVDGFLRAVAETPGAEQDLGEELVAELSQARDALDETLRTSAPAEPDPAPTPLDAPPIAQPEPSSDSALSARRRPNRLALGLVVGGSALVATGIGISVGYFTIRRGALRLVDASPDFGEGTPQREAYLEQEDGRAQKFLIAGTVVAAAGLAAAIGGTIHWVVSRSASPSRDNAARVSPLVTPSFAGVELSRRF